MKKLKIFMDHRNYMGIGNTHIFINFNRDNLNYLSNLHPHHVHTIHVFITNHASINDDLRSLIQRFGRLINNGKKYSKIILHLPCQIKDLQQLMKKFLIEEIGYKLIIEKKGPMFHIQDNYFLNISYFKKSLCPNTVGHRTSNPVSIKFMEYPYDMCIDNDPGIFETTEMRELPEMFREKLIEAFKQKTPEKILRASFKTDDDIWEYIMTQGEWSIKKEGKK